MCKLTGTHLGRMNRSDLTPPLIRTAAGPFAADPSNVIRDRAHVSSTLPARRRAKSGTQTRGRLIACAAWQGTSLRVGSGP
jgi:hypothetical protein